MLVVLEPYKIGIKISRPIPLYFLVLVLAAICIVDGTSNFKIIGIERYESAIQLERGEDPLQSQNIWSANVEERRRACEAAYNNVSRIQNFVYKPYQYQPEVLQYDFLNQIQRPEKRSLNFLNSFDNNSSDGKEDEDEGEEYNQSATSGKFAIYCGTLPSLYVRISISQLENVSTKYLTAILIESACDPFQIRRQDEKPKVVLRDNPLVQLNLEDRRGLCIAASKNHHSITFFSNLVSEARTYELEYSRGKKEIIIGIHCPVVPPIILHQKGKRSPLNLSFISVPVDEYGYGGFEAIIMSRYSENQDSLTSSILSRNYQTGWSFCMFIQKQLPVSNRNLFTIDSRSIGRARVYSFIYPSGAEINYVGVQCAEAPTMFLHVDESKKEVKMLVFSSTANKLSRSVSASTSHPSSAEYHDRE